MKKHKIICSCCGTEFFSTAHNAKFCSDSCEKKANKQRSQEIKASRVRFQNTKERPNKGLLEYLREIEAYNETHGTSFTYGQYTAMLEKGGAA